MGRFQRFVEEIAPIGLASEEIDPDAMAVLIYSGGTTGVAKGIMLSHFNFVANAHQAIAWGHLTDEQGVLAVLPFFHGFGMSVTMNGAVLAGGEIICCPALTQSKWRRPSKSTSRPSLSAYRQCLCS